MRFYRILSTLLLLLGTITASFGQLYPIAVGRDSVFCGGAAFDGTNFLLTMTGDTNNSNNITAQLVSPAIGLVGPRISLGAQGSLPLAVFDGTNYLVVWGDPFPMFGESGPYATGSVYGQFLSTSGTLVGSRFVIATNVNIKFSMGRGALAFQDSLYLVLYVKGGDHTDMIYGRRISRSGAFVGGEFQVSTTYAREMSIAFDGTNYLVAWVQGDEGGRSVHGRLLSPAGAAVGEQFLIDGSSGHSDNPVYSAFDGTRYLVIYHDQSADRRWNLFARFITPAGTVAPERVMICDSTRAPFMPMVIFDGTRYLATWMETNGLAMVKGRFFTTSGEPSDTAFTVFPQMANRFFFGGIGAFINDAYFFAGTSLDTNFTDGDIYGMLIPATSLGVGGTGDGVIPERISLLQNYPNPFNPSTVIGYELPSESYVRLTVYNTLGQEVAVLVNGVVGPGRHAATWDARSVPSGVYFYRLDAAAAGDRTRHSSQTRKLVLIR